MPLKNPNDIPASLQSLSDALDALAATVVALPGPTDETSLTARVAALETDHVAMIPLDADGKPIARNGYLRSLTNYIFGTYFFGEKQKHDAQWAIDHPAPVDATGTGTATAQGA